MSGSRSVGDQGRQAGVRRAAAGDGTIVRDLRLRALAESPQEFDSTLEQETARTAEEWGAWISEAAVFILDAPGGPGGIAAGVARRDEPSSALHASVWVDPALRGAGGAGALVAAVLDWAECERFEEIGLHVVVSNERARRLYERNGFRAVGEVARERDGVVELEMRRPLGSEMGPGAVSASRPG